MANGLIERAYSYLTHNLKKIKTANGFNTDVPDGHVLHQQSPQTSQRIPAIYVNHGGVDFPSGSGMAEGIAGRYTAIVRYSIVGHTGTKAGQDDLLTKTLQFQADILKAIHDDLYLRTAASENGDSTFVLTHHRISVIDADEGLVYPESVIIFGGEFWFDRISLDDL